MALGVLLTGGWARQTSIKAVHTTRHANFVVGLVLDDGPSAGHPELED